MGNLRVLSVRSQEPKSPFWTLPAGERVLLPSPLDRTGRALRGLLTRLVMVYRVDVYIKQDLAKKIELSADHTF